MAAALLALQWLVTASFLLLGLQSLFAWRRTRDQRSAYLAIALGLLALVFLSSRINAATANRFTYLTTPVTIVLFMGSGYSVLLFRDTFVPLRRWTRVLVAVLAAATAAFYIVVAPPPARAAHIAPVESIALLALILLWSGMVAEPIVRFWLASRGRPVVQRVRLRLLSLGFSAIIFILVIAGAGGARLSSSLALQFGLELLALVSIPLIIASLAPPRWLVRTWRAPEEAAFRRAVRELVLFSSDRASLAERALEWWLPVVGSDGGAIVDETGILAIRGIDPDLARRLAADADHTMKPRLLRLDKDWQNAVVVPLALDKGPGAVVAVSNAFMPLFGSDEVDRLEEFGTLVTAGLDRVRITERMAELERTKSQFLNLASHELRTPLSVIRGYLSILESGSLDTTSPAGRKAISVLSAKGVEMNMLIEQMLEAARLEEGRVVLRLESVNACEATAAAVEIVRPLADDRHRLIVDCGSDAVWATADRDRLSTILVNLIDNAIKYSPDGGDVVCCVRTDGEKAFVSVQDRGVGIAAENLPLLFTKFSRVPDSRTQHIGGTGLGLYLCRELARQQGGDITVASIPGRGSTFTVALPLVAAVEEPKLLAPETLTVLEPAG